MLGLLLFSMAMVVAGPPDLATPASDVGTRNAWTISSEAPPAAVVPMLDHPADEVGAAAATATLAAAAPTPSPTLSMISAADPGDGVIAAAPAAAVAPPLNSMQEVGDDILQDQRGGFDIGGVNVTLGAQIQTTIDGQPALLTTVNWTDTSATTTQTVTGVLTPATAAQLQAGVLNTGHISMKVGDSSVFLANDGQTAVIHNTSAGLQSILVNTANNTAISTQVTATVNLAGYSAFQDNLKTATLGASLGQAVGAATLGSVMN
jgi:hypothetical protein